MKVMAEGRNNIKVVAARQISAQQPLSEEWMDSPVRYTEPLVRSVDPDFKQFVSAGDARRMGRLLKRAIATSVSALQDAGVEHPDAIITGTGFGSIENTELFLDQLVRQGEEMLKPTQFMQSTHNTVSSLIGIHTKSHGYNCTYSHKGLSFDSALYDAWLQMKLCRIGTALVGSHDEMSPIFSGFVRKAGYVRDGEFASEAAVSVLLSKNEADAPMCTLQGVKILSQPSDAQIQEALQQMLEEAGMTAKDIDACMTSKSGNAETDAQCAFIDALLPGVPQLQYKPVFGVGFSASALGFYASACCLKEGRVPACLTADGKELKGVRTMLLVNAVEDKHVSLILLCGR